MEILILGGTIFLGRALVEAALVRGHSLTLFNRGITNPHLYPGVEELYGDRLTDLSPLQERHWDAVVDTSAYFPRAVRLSASLLSGQVQHYTLISSMSVYADLSRPGVAEDAPVGALQDESIEEVNGETYGLLKVQCERAAEEAMPGRVLTVRPGLIVGPQDPTDRFTYWPHRVALGGEVLVPGDPVRQIQFIDVRDLAEWIIRMIEINRTGIFNATGRMPPISMGDFLNACKSVSHSDASFTWVSDGFLLKNGVTPWTEVPLWVPESDPNDAGIFKTGIRKAINSGLAFRPVEETIRATLDWDATRSAGHPWRAGLSAGKETRLLAVWHSRAI